jgi:hypothetical protein
MYRGEGDREGGATTRGLALVPACNCECLNWVGLGGAGGKPTGPRETGMATGWEIAGVGFAVQEGLVNCAGEIGMGAGPAGGEIAGVIVNARVGGAGRACRAGKVGSAGGTVRAG